MTQFWPQSPERASIANVVAHAHLQTVDRDPNQKGGLYSYLTCRRRRIAQHDEERATEGLVALRDETGATAPLPAAAWLARLKGTLQMDAGQLRRDWAVNTALRERISGVNARLEVAMAAGHFARVRIQGPGDGGVRDGRYGLLGLAPADIHFGNAQTGDRCVTTTLRPASVSPSRPEDATMPSNNLLTVATGHAPAPGGPSRRAVYAALRRCRAAGAHRKDHKALRCLARSRADRRPA